MRLSTKLHSAGPDPHTWLALLFLFLAVILPAGAVLWFMSDAASSQAESARRSVVEVYQGQLRFLRDRVDEVWTAPAESSADAVLVLNADGSLKFPEPLGELKADPTEDRAPWTTARALEAQRSWQSASLAYARIAVVEKDASIAARALQGQIRNLVRADKKEEAAALILHSFPAMTARDAQGRSIAADELLLAVNLLTAKDRRRTKALQNLTAILNDYTGHPMPSAQRLFLMREAGAAGGGPFPTLETERLAAEFLEADQPRVTGTALQATALPGVWKLGAGRTILLFRTETVMRRIQQVAKEYSASGVEFVAIPPASASSRGEGGESIPAGATLPGWQLGFTMDSKLMDEAGSKRQNAYLLTGYVVIAAMIVAGLLAGNALRSQMRVARLKTDLVAAVSHELKTPSASIRLLVDSLLEDRELDPRKTKDYLALISSENLRLTRLIDNFLTFSRIERNRQRFDFAPVEPARIVEEAVSAVRERFDCDLTVSMEANLPQVRADGGAMVSVLTNLLENAYKYSPGERRIEVRAFSDRGRVVFSVQDNGIGIPAREQKRIFRKFYQVDQTLSRDAGGCGLGLSIVDHIVRAHGGEVTVQSKPHEGSTFSVTLPA